MPDLGTVVVLALAAFRVVRLVQRDSITVAFRERLYAFAWDEEHPVPEDASDPSSEPVAAPRAPWRTWLWELVAGCPWCLGVWVSVAVWAVWRWGGDPAHAVLIVAAVAGVQGLAATWETR